MNNKEIDQTKLTRMYGRIRLLESNNLKTGKLNDGQLVNKIVAIMQDVLKEGE